MFFYHLSTSSSALAGPLFASTTGATTTGSSFFTDSFISPFTGSVQRRALTAVILGSFVMIECIKIKIRHQFGFT
jgi:hypothetical protein